MWVIKKLGLATVNRGVAYEPFLSISAWLLRTHSVMVHISNTVTGDYVVLKNDIGLLEFIAALAEYNPYGFFKARHFSVDEHNCSCTLVVIDDLSLQFLDYVERVENVRLYDGDPLIEFTDKQTLPFRSIDYENNTVFMVEVDIECYSTLFHSMLYLSDGWVDDVFYMRARKSRFDEKAWDYYDTAYKVVFSDVTTARAMFAKAIVNKINPVRAILYH